MSSLQTIISFDLIVSGGNGLVKAFIMKLNIKIYSTEVARARTKSVTYVTWHVASVELRGIYTAKSQRLYYGTPYNTIQYI